MISVLDGDTLKVRYRNGSRATVRLIGIDTPETRKPRTRAECGGRQATNYMKRLVVRKNTRGRRVGRLVRLRRDPAQDNTDRYGRSLRYVNIAGSNLGVARRMVRAGWAEVSVFEDPFQRLRSFQAAETTAEREGRGVHGMCEGRFHTPAH